MDRKDIKSILNYVLGILVIVIIYLIALNGRYEIILKDAYLLDKWNKKIIYVLDLNEEKNDN